MERMDILLPWSVLLLVTRVRYLKQKGEASKRRTKLPAYCTLDPQIIKQQSSCSSVQEENIEETKPIHGNNNRNKDKNHITLHFHQVSKEDSWLVGGKGANLGELTSAGFPVPAGFCVTKHAFDHHMKKQQYQGKSLFETIEKDGDMSTAAARALVVGAPLSLDIEENVKTAYRKLCNEDGGDGSDILVAVRSSATAEDSSEASFAGQLDTFLGIKGEEDVLLALKECWASLYSERVDSYRKMVGKGRGTNESSISVCVVIQKMLDADCAGVMFTANPFTHALNETVITGNWGLGESVVADIASPDTWILEEEYSNYQIKSTQIAKKLKKVILSKIRTEHGCSEIVDITDEQEQDKPCLSTDQLKNLANLGKRVQAHYGNHPQDTEWGVKNGKIYLLQARPITTLSDEKPRDIQEFDTPCRPDDFITTCNAAEMFPGPMTPLTMSTFGRMADQGVQRMQIMFGCREKIDHVHRVTANYFGNFFLNMSNTLAPMCAGMVGAQMAKDNGEMSILGSLNEKESLDRLIQIGGGQRFILTRLLNGMRYLKTMLFASYRIPIMKNRILFCEKQFQLLMERKDLSSAIVWDKIDSLMDEFDDQWTDGIVTSSTSAAAMLVAMKLLTERGGNIWGTQPVGELAVLLGDTLAGGAAESAGAVEALDHIRDRIYKENGKTSATSFASSSPEEALNWLQSKPSLLNDFNDLLTRHGHRCVREAEMREKDWSEDSLPLIRMLQSSVRAAVNRGEDGFISSSTKSGSDPEKIYESKKHLNFLTRRILRFAVKITRKSVHLRELGKSLQVKLNASFKHTYRKLGLLMVKEGRLPEADLLYFLTHEEIGKLCCVPIQHLDVHRLKTRAAQRRRLFARQGQLKFPELSLGCPKPIEKHMGGEIIGQVLKGTPVSAGFTKGQVRVARTLEDAEALKEGEILITPQTDVGWTPYFSVAGGLVTEIGGMLSHGAVVAREYSLPCIVGITGACDLIQTGMTVELDGDCGLLKIISTEIKN